MDFALACYCNRLGAGHIDGVTDLVCAVWFLAVVWLGLLALVWLLDRARARAVTIGVAIAIGVDAIVTEVLLKHGLLYFLPKRVRPWMAHPTQIVPVGFHYQDSSFPSGHAASTAAILTVLCWHYPRAVPLALIFAAGMAFARVHDGMHYPTDVLVGTCFGIGYGFAALALARRLTRSKPNRSEP